MTKKRRWFGYALFCIAGVVFFLYYLFPSDVVENYVQVRAEHSNPPLLLSIERITPWPLLGLRSAKTEVSLKNKPQLILFRAENISLKPGLWSFIKRKPKYSIDINAYGGEIRGDIIFKRINMEGPFYAEIDINRIRVGNHEHMKDFVGRKIDGTLSGKIYYSGQQNRLISGSGEATLKLSEGTVELLVPLLSLNAIEFDEAVVELILKSRKIRVTRLELEGPQLKSSITGTISLRKQLAMSSLNLRGTIEPFAAMVKNVSGLGILKNLQQRLRRGVISFTIRGTLNQPKIRFT
jgi:type II secretion system protein N